MNLHYKEMLVNFFFLSKLFKKVFMVVIFNSREKRLIPKKSNTKRTVDGETTTSKKERFIGSLESEERVNLFQALE